MSSKQEKRKRKEQRYEQRCRFGYTLKELMRQEPPKKNFFSHWRWERRVRELREWSEK